MWYVIGILFVLFVVLGLSHSHTVARKGPPQEEHNDEYIHRIYTDREKR